LEEPVEKQISRHLRKSNTDFSILHIVSGMLV
jgi:hypothetical protein